MGASAPTDHPLKCRRLGVDDISLDRRRHCNDCGQAGQMFLDPSDNMQYCQQCWVLFYGLQPKARDDNPALCATPRGTRALHCTGTVAARHVTAGSVDAREATVTEASTDLALSAVSDRMATVQAWLVCKHCDARWPPGTVKKVGFQNMRSSCKLHGKKCRDSEKYRDAR